jgi:hypothetical protein
MIEWISLLLLKRRIFLTVNRISTNRRFPILFYRAKYRAGRKSEYNRNKLEHLSETEISKGVRHRDELRSNSAVSLVKEAESPNQAVGISNLSDAKQSRLE